MPFTSDEVIDRLEAKLSNVKSVTALLDAGMTPEQILEEMCIRDSLRGAFFHTKYIPAVNFCKTVNV